MKMKKVTQKDRYGNQVSYEYEPDTKPLDITTLFEKLLDKEIPEYFEIPESSPIGGGVKFGFGPTHPGEPRGQDTVPAWLTPGEFVVNKEAMDDPRNAAMVEQINNQGRAIQQAKGGMVPYYQEGGDVPIPMSPTETLLRAREGFRPDVYEDTRGYPTVGHGHRLPNEYLQRIGEQPFSTDQLNSMFYEDIDSAEAAAKRNAKSYGVKWDDLNKREKTALTSMAFQLGEQGQKDFENMWTKLAAGDKEGAALEALDSAWAGQTPQRAKDVYDSLTPGLGFNYGGPVYAYRGYDVAQQDAFDIEDPNADLSGGWLPPIYGADEISPMEQAILDKEAAAPPPPPGNIGGAPITSPDLQQAEVWEKQYAGRDPDDVGFVDGPPVPAPAAEGEVPWWEGIADWTFGEEGTRAARERNAEFNVKAAENNLAAAEENLAELEAREEAGEPVNELTLQGAQEAVVHQEAKVAEAEATSNELLGEGAGDDLVESNVPGTDDDVVSLEELATSPEFEGQDDPSKPSDKGQQHPDQVVAEGEKVKKESPDMVKKAEGFFKDAFSDLFDGKELARMALMYVGSRALGYSHGGSLNWAAKQYVNRLDTKAAKFDKLASDGKYTTESIAAYKESGNIADLRPVGAPAKRTGNFKTFYKNGKPHRAEEIDVGGSKTWVTPNGTQIDSTYGDDPSTVPGTKEYSARVKDYRTVTSQQLESMRSQFDRQGSGEETFYKTDINPHTSSGKIAEWAAKNNVDPNQLAGLVESAYHDALNDQRQDGSKARDLVPYLNQLVVRQHVGQPDAFLAKGYDGEGPKQYVDSEKLATLNRSISGLMGHYGKTGPVKDLANQFYDAALRDWNALGAEGQKEWNSKARDDESGFYKYAEHIVTTKGLTAAGG